MKIARLTLVLALLFPALVGCDLPRDPESTLVKVRGGTLTVGIGGPGGPTDPGERAALERLASDVGAEITYHSAELHKLAAELQDGRIDIIAGHLPQKTPFSKELGLSAPVSTTRLGNETVKTVFAVRKGENGFLQAVETAIGESR